jgi:hypothetical protein
MMIAPFDAAYTAKKGSATRPLTELVLMMEPPPVPSMCGMAALQP